MEIRLALRIRAPPQYVFQWWTDFRGDDPEMVRSLLRRRVVTLSEGEAVLEDTIRILHMTMSFTCSVTKNPPDRWVAAYSGREAEAFSSYRVYASDAGSVLEYSSQIRIKGLLKLVGPIIKRVIRSTFKREMQDYVRFLEQDWSHVQRTFQYANRRASPGA